jgi:hypothetical protein
MTIRRYLGWVLVGGLVVAALAASGAIVEGSFDDDDWKVIGTSLGFSVYSALAAAGASLRLRASERQQLLGLWTMVLSGAAFVLLLAWVWPEPEGEGIARTWGAVSLAALAASHACIVTAARRSTDTDGVSLLATASIVLGVVDATAAALAVIGVVDDVGDGLAELFAVLVIALLLTTVLPPILRKLGRPAAAPAAAGGATVDGRVTRLAQEVLEAADRIEAMNAGRGPEIRRECERLRRVARQYTH